MPPELDIYAITRPTDGELWKPRRTHPGRGLPATGRARVPCESERPLDGFLYDT